MEMKLGGWAVSKRMEKDRRENMVMRDQQKQGVQSAIVHLWEEKVRANTQLWDKTAQKHVIEGNRPPNPIPIQFTQISPHFCEQKALRSFPQHVVTTSHLHCLCWASHQTSLPGRAIIADLIKVCHATVLSWPASKCMRWPPLILSDNDRYIRTKSLHGTWHPPRDGHSIVSSEGAGDKEDLETLAVHMDGSGCPWSQQAEDAARCHMCWWYHWLAEQIRQKWPENWVSSMQKHH